MHRAPARSYQHGTFHGVYYNPLPIEIHRDTTTFAGLLHVFTKARVDHHEQEVVLRGMTLFDDVRGPSWTLRPEAGAHTTDDPQAAPAPPLYLQHHEETRPLVLHPVQHSLPQHRMRNVVHMFELRVPLHSLSMDAKDWWTIRVHGSDRLVALTATFDHAARVVQEGGTPRVWTFIGMLFGICWLSCILPIQPYMHQSHNHHRWVPCKTAAVPCAQCTSTAGTCGVAPAHGV